MMLRRNKFLNKSAMTMIEVLIVAGLVGAVSVSIYGALSTGIKVWQRSRGSAAEQDITIFFDKLTKDLHSAFYFSTLTPQGRGDKFTFPTFVPVTLIVNEEPVEQLGLVEYEFKPIENQLWRSQGGYGAALDKRLPSAQIVLNGVENVDFRYIYVSDGQQLTSDHLLETLPASVEVTVSFEDPYGRHEMKKLIDLPLSL